VDLYLNPLTLAALRYIQGRSSYECLILCYLLLLGRVALVRGIAGYGRHTFPVDDLSVGLSVRTYVGLSSALWKRFMDVSPPRRFAPCLDVSPTGRFAPWTFRPIHMDVSPLDVSLHTRGRFAP